MATVTLMIGLSYFDNFMLSLLEESSPPTYVLGERSPLAVPLLAFPHWVSRLPLPRSIRRPTRFPRVTLVRHVVGLMLCRALLVQTRWILKRRRPLAACAFAPLEWLSPRFVRIALFVPMEILLRRTQAYRIPSLLGWAHLMASDPPLGVRFPLPIVMIPLLPLAVRIALLLYWTLTFARTCLPLLVGLRCTLNGEAMKRNLPCLIGNEQLIAPLILWSGPLLMLNCPFRALTLRTIRWLHPRSLPRLTTCRRSLVQRLFAVQFVPLRFRA